MNIYQKIKLIFTYSGELEQVVSDMRQKVEDEERLTRAHNLNLCYKHRQESSHSHYSPHNCDYCKLQEQALKVA